jgi:hypothetical protein
MKKKVLYVLGAILLVLIITNPTLKDYKDFKGSNGDFHPRRISNFFVCSVYVGAGKYLGVLGNFYKINTNNRKINPPIAIDSTIKKDSVVIIDSSLHK